MHEEVEAFDDDLPMQPFKGIAECLLMAVLDGEPAGK